MKPKQGTSNPFLPTKTNVPKANKGPKRSNATITVGTNSNVSLRKIENGYIVSESGMTGKGRNSKYFSKEYFSPTVPKSTIKFGK